MCSGEPRDMCSGEHISLTPRPIAQRRTHYYPYVAKIEGGGTVLLYGFLVRCVKSTGNAV